MARRQSAGSSSGSVVLGVGCFLLGWYFLWDAYDGRGKEQPAWMRPFTWW